MKWIRKNNKTHTAKEGVSLSPSYILNRIAREQRKKNPIIEAITIAFITLVACLIVATIMKANLIKEAKKELIPEAYGQEKEEQPAKEDLIIDKLFDTTTVIGCYNQYSKTSRTIAIGEEKCAKAWDHNISIPPKSHIEKWRAVWWNDRQIVNRFAIVNFESNFREYVWNPYAYWYVQTLRKWNIAPEVEPQLQWMYDRQVYQAMEYSKWGSKRCWWYADNYNARDGFNAWEEWVMACLYRYHYHAYNWTWYAKKAMSARQIYINYFY